MDRDVEIRPENAALAYFVQRAIPPVQATLQLYRSAFSHLAERWPHVEVSTLQHQVEEMVPEASLFNVWQILLETRRRDAGQIADTQAYLRAVREALSRILDKHPNEHDLNLVSELGSPAREAARRYIELVNTKD